MRKARRSGLHLHRELNRLAEAVGMNRYDLTRRLLRIALKEVRNDVGILVSPTAAKAPEQLEEDAQAAA